MKTAEPLVFAGQPQAQDLKSADCVLQIGLRSELLKSKSLERR